MCQYRKCNYNTLADFARAVGVDRSTVLAWARQGKIKSRKGGNGKKRHYLRNDLFNQSTIQKFCKPYQKFSTRWTPDEKCILQNWQSDDLSLAHVLGRSVQAVRNARCRMRMSNERR